MNNVLKLFEGVKGDFAVGYCELDTENDFYYNEDESFVAASTIKVPIMVEVFKQAHEGKLHLDNEIAISFEEQVAGSGIVHELTPGTKLTIRDLVKLMIIQSDNTATNIMIDLVGSKNITKTMTDLGLNGLKIYNKLQIIEANRKNINTVNARDLTKLMILMARGKVVSTYACERMIAILKAQQIRNIIPYYLPENREDYIGQLPLIEIAHKGGSISGVRHDFGIVYTTKGAYAVTLLSKNLESNEEGTEILTRASQKIFQEFVNSHD